MQRPSSPHNASSANRNSFYAHSSSSAIFERDIEPILPPSPPSSSVAHNNPHRIPRAKTTEQLEQAVPSVLDSAAEVITAATSDDDVAVVSPSATGLDVFHPTRSISTGGASGGGLGAGPAAAGGPGSGFASPISLRSRSPSPIRGLGAATSPTSATLFSNSALLSPPPMNSSLFGLAATTTTTASATAPGAATTTLTTTGLADPDAGATIVPNTTLSHSPRTVPNRGLSPGSSPIHSPAKSTPSLLSSPTSLSPASPLPSSPSQSHPPSNALSTNPNPSSHPPSPLHIAKKRLSFMSYSDLLSSTPSSTQPLSSLTTAASTVDPPPHIPSVSGLTVAAALSAHGTHTNPHSPVGHGYHNIITLPPRSTSTSRAASVHNVSLSPTTTTAGAPLVVSNPGGEWEREGLGRGLEERLEGLGLNLGCSHPHSSPKIDASLLPPIIGKEPPLNLAAAEAVKEPL